MVTFEVDGGNAKNGGTLSGGGYFTEEENVETTLFKDAPVETEYQEIKVSTIDELVPDAANIVTPPTAAFIENVRQHGVLVPILLIHRARGKKLDLAEGRRRIVAAKEVGLETIPARIYPHGWTRAGVLTLVTNEQRRGNLVAEYQALESLIGDGDTEDDISNRTGVPKKRLRIILSLRNLIPELKNAFLAGKIKNGVALNAAKQTKAVQYRLAKVLEGEGELTAKLFAEVRRANKQEVVAALPPDLFGDVAEDWRDQALGTLESLQRALGDKAAPAFLDALGRLIEEAKTN